MYNKCLHFTSIVLMHARIHTPDCSSLLVNSISHHSRRIFGFDLKVHVIVQSISLVSFSGITNLLSFSALACKLKTNNLPPNDVPNVYWPVINIIPKRARLWLPGSRRLCRSSSTYVHDPTAIKVLKTKWTLKIVCECVHVKTFCRR